MAAPAMAGPPRAHNPSCPWRAGIPVAGNPVTVGLIIYGYTCTGFYGADTYSRR